MDFQQILKCLKDNSLRKINIANGHMSQSEVEQLADALKTNTLLATLRLNNMSIPRDGVKVLAKVLEVNKNIKAYHICKDKIDAEGATVLANALQHNQVLKELNLFMNEISDEGVKAIAGILGKTKLIALDVKKNNIAKVGIEALAFALKSNTTLIDLTLDYNNCSNVDSMRALIDALGVNKTLQKLYLRETGLDTECIKVLAAGLNKTAIKSLSIDGNTKIGLEGFEKIAEALKTNTSLEILNISCTYLNTAGIAAITAGLEVNATLKALWMNHNELGDESCEYIANLLRKNKVLAALHLYHNWLGSTSAQLIASTLEKYNYTLQEIDISLNPCTSDGVSTSRIYESIKRNIALRKNPGDPSLKMIESKEKPGIDAKTDSASTRVPAKEAGFGTKRKLYEAFPNKREEDKRPVAMTKPTSEVHVTYIPQVSRTPYTASKTDLAKYYPAVMSENSISLEDAEKSSIPGAVLLRGKRGIIARIRRKPYSTADWCSEIYLIYYEDKRVEILRTLSCDVGRQDLIKEFQDEYDISKRLGNIEQIQDLIAKPISKLHDEAAHNKTRLLAYLQEWGGVDASTFGFGKLPPWAIAEWMFRSVCVMAAIKEAGEACYSDINPSHMLLFNTRIMMIGFSSVMPGQSALHNISSINPAEVKATQEDYSPPEWLRASKEEKRTLSNEAFEIFSWGMSFYQIIGNVSVSELKKERARRESKDFDSGKYFSEFIMKVMATKYAVHGECQTVLNEKLIPLLATRALRYDPEARGKIKEIKEKIAWFARNERV